MLSACSRQEFGLRFSEPYVYGAVIDKITKKPIQGAIVYGYYATVTGSLGGGESISKYVHNFEAITDANGRFTLPAWGSSDFLDWGSARDNFPALAIYAPGYETYLKNFHTIRDWSPNDASYALQSAPTKGFALDWAAYPVELGPVKSEKSRFFEITNLGRWRGGGKCAWETYARIIQVEHWEYKAWLKRNVPADGLDARGYKRSGYWIPGEAIPEAYPFSTYHDDLLTAFSQQQPTGGGWPCADPTKLLNVDDYVAPSKS